MEKMTVARAFAAALRQAGAGVVTHVPGFGATEAFEAFREPALSSFPLSFHEEVAFGIAQGAALAGTRAATVIKAHGLAKATNAAVDALCTGVNAGLVVGVFHDRRGEHSDSILDVFALLRGLRLPYRLCKPGGVYAETFEAFRQSERQSLPVAVVVLSETIHAPSICPPQEPLPIPPSYTRSVPRHVLCPPLAEYQRQLLEARLGEQDWRAIPEPSLPAVPDGLGPHWGPKCRPYVPLFEVFRELRGSLVAGDTGVSGLFAFPPFDAIDACAYMGGSLPLAIGAMLAGRRDAWAVTGDFAFVAAGHLGLAEAAKRGLPLKVLLLANGVSLSTGGQPVPAEALDAVLEGYRPCVRTIRDPSDRAEARAVLGEAARAGQLRVVVADYRIKSG